MRFAAAGDTAYAYFDRQAEAVEQLSARAAVIYSGTAVGRLFGRELKPDPASAFFCGLNREAVAVTELDLPQALRYLRKEELAAEDFAGGMNLVTSGGVALGYAKRIGGRVNNLYPSSLRIVNK